MARAKKEPASGSGAVSAIPSDGRWRLETVGYRLIEGLLRPIRDDADPAHREWSNPAETGKYVRSKQTMLLERMIGPCFDDNADAVVVFGTWTPTPTEGGEPQAHATAYNHRWSQYVTVSDEHGVYADDDCFDAWFWRVMDGFDTGERARIAAGLSRNLPAGAAAEPDGPRIPEASAVDCRYRFADGVDVDDWARYRGIGDVTVSYRPISGFSFYGQCGWQDARGQLAEREQLRAAGMAGGELYLSRGAAYRMRGIGPHGELILRLRPVGSLRLEPDAGWRIFPFQQGDRNGENAAGRNCWSETDAWRADVGERLKADFRSRSIGADNYLDYAVCFPYAVAAWLDRVQCAGDRAAACRTMIDALQSADDAFDAAPPAGLRMPDDPYAIAQVIAQAMIRLYLNHEHDHSGRGFGQVLADCLNAHAEGLVPPYLPDYLDGVAEWGRTIPMRRPDGNDEAPTYDEGFVDPGFIGAQPVQWLASVAGVEGGRRGLFVRANAGMGKSTFVRGMAYVLGGLLPYEYRSARNRTPLRAGFVDYMRAQVDADQWRAIAGSGLIPVVIAQRDVPYAMSATEADVRETEWYRSYDALRSGPLEPEEFTAFLYDHLPEEMKTRMYGERVRAPQRRGNDFDALMALGGRGCAAGDAVAVGVDRFRRLLKRPDTLVLIDSVDEIPFQCRGNFLESLERLIADDGYAIGRYIITSRSLGGTEESRIDRLCGDGERAEFAPFDEPRQRRLFDILDRSYGGMAPVGFEAVRATPGFGSLLGNPGMLAAIVEELKRSDGSVGTLVNRCLANIERILPKTGGEIPGCDRIAIAHLAYDAIVPERRVFADGVERAASNGQGVFDRERFLELFNRYREEDGNGDRADNEEALDRTISRCGIFREDADTIRFEYDAVKAYFAAIWLCRRLAVDEDGGVMVDRFLADNGHVSDAVAIAMLCALERMEIGGDGGTVLRTFYRRVLCAAFAHDDYRQRSGMVAATNAQRVLRLMNDFDFGGPVRQPEPIAAWHKALCGFPGASPAGGTR